MISVALSLVLLAGLGGCRPRTATLEPTATPTPTTTPAPTSTPTPSPLPPSAPRPAPRSTVRVYLLQGEKVAPNGRIVIGSAVAKSAMEQLLRGPNGRERGWDYTSSIPSGTKLRSLKIADGTATVDLSSQFGSGGGSLSMQTRVAQVVFTLTQFPTVKRVVFWMDGVPVEALGGEGLVLDEPQTRADWEDFAPAVLVESPLPGATVRSPLRVAGSANVFEAVFQLELQDRTGSVIARKSVKATSGTGTRGTFAATMTWTARPKPGGTGTLIAWYASPKDGSRVEVFRVPLRVR